MNRLMMITILGLIVPIILFAQINWTEHVVTDNFGQPFSVYAEDMDNDGDIDILGAANYSDDDIAWWENDGGCPPNFTQHTITDSFEYASCVYAIDLDNDNDIDILGAANYSDDDIVWWENDGASPPNFTEHTIADNFEGAYSVYAIDLDNDGDVDVLGAAQTADDITWWENDGASPPNFTEHVIDSTFDGARSVYAEDMDNDGDVDVLGAANIANDITWWENNGASPPSFTKHTISDFFHVPWSVYAIDLDDDNDMDVLGAAAYEDDITWWENDGASPPNFITEHAIPGSMGGAFCVFAIDLNDDNDIDVLGAGGFSSIHWWESDLLDIYDVGPVSIDIPSTIPEDTTFYPKATVKNFSTNPQTFPVTCTIEPGAYMKTQTVNDLTPGDSIQITFLNEATFETGTYTATVYTRFGDDMNRTNDTLVKIIETVDMIPPLIESTTVWTDTSFTGPFEIYTKVTDMSSGVDNVILWFRRLEDPNWIFREMGGGSWYFEEIPGVGLLDDTVKYYIYAEDIAGCQTYTDTFSFVASQVGISELDNTPASFSFGLRNNPAKSKALFNVTLPEAATVTLRIYDVTGRIIDKVISGRKSAGYYEIPWTSEATTGVYFYRFESPWNTEVGKLILVR